MNKEEIIYEAPDNTDVSKEDIDALIDAHIQNSLLPVWFQDLQKTALSRNITIDDWNTLCYLVRRISADNVSYASFKEFSDALCNYIKNNYSLQSHNLVSVVSDTNEITFTFEDGSSFSLTKEDFGIHAISSVELEAILTRNLL